MPYYITNYITKYQIKQDCDGKSEFSAAIVQKNRNDWKIEIF